MITDQEIRGSTFQVAGEDVTRQDLAFRREVKYLLPNADVGKFRRLLESNGRRLVHNKPVSAVRSIYFDDASNVIYQYQILVFNWLFGLFSGDRFIGWDLFIWNHIIRVSKMD